MLDACLFVIFLFTLPLLLLKNDCDGVHWGGAQGGGPLLKGRCGRRVLLGGRGRGPPRNPGRPGRNLVPGEPDEPEKGFGPFFNAITKAKTKLSWAR